MIKKVMTGLLAGLAATGAPAQDRPPLPETYEQLIEMAFHHAQALQAGHNAGWGMDKATSYDVDLSAGTITFFLPDGKKAQAAAQLLGTWNPNDETFLWGWDHPSAPLGTATASAALRGHASQHGIDQLSTPKITCDFEACFSIAATAILVADLQGIYRLDAGGPWAYIGFDTVTLSRQ
ncbi:DUF6882 domain-containing protein [Actibacterium sp. 188UL27-1]|uniref:DUF6882 domain-containing protein n=1 Tax=Actibacterium sp. 188UL27-1 TaxID=2786961 RepID=UPI0019563526|nr:DUF6882 domain-containing protein [Actibacterium sp. 188UL27-1]MBM7068944.1 hypothetical protein [Actibacterium sp. 188UL27-1]